MEGATHFIESWTGVNGNLNFGNSPQLPISLLYHVLKVGEHKVSYKTIAIFKIKYHE